MELNGKTILITGGTGGIGLELRTCFIRHALRTVPSPLTSFEINE